jgi:ribosomal protein S18 acetylase RimI-like enzyme
MIRTTKLRYRTFVRSFLPGLVSCWNRVFAGKRNAYPVSEELWRHRVADQPAFDPEGLILALTSSGEVAGFVHAIRPAPDPFFVYVGERCGSSGSIAALAVAQDWRGQGVGAALLEQGERYLRRHLRPGSLLYSGDYYVPLYHTLEGPRQPFWGDTEVIGITERDLELLGLLSSRGYLPAELPGKEVAMSAELVASPTPPAPDLRALGLREVTVREERPWEGRIAWYPPEEPPGYFYGRFGPYRHCSLALAREDSITSHLEWYPMAQPGRAALWDFRVAEEDRGHGLGSYLLDRALRLMAQQGFARVELHTNTHNNEQAFGMFRKRGFEITACWLAFQKRV